MNPIDTLQLVAMVLYLIATGMVGFGIHTDRRALVRVGVAVTLVAVVVHGASFVIEMGRIGGFNADFFNSLALVSLINLLVVLVGLLRFAWVELLILALPGTAGFTLLKLLISPTPMALDTGAPMMDLHVISSLLSYSMLSIAAVTAVFIALLHNLLHRHRGMAMIEILPPLVSMEKMLFQMIGAGWVILTISLVTGLLFVDNLFAQHLAHKTFLSILSWLVFGLLLAGRWRYGWRGMRVVRLCLIGMAILLLAYFGSKAVLELVLDRHWSAA